MIVVIISFCLGIALLVLGCGFVLVAKCRQTPHQSKVPQDGEWTGRRNEYRHIWETPLPQPSAPTLSSNHDSHSYMNDPRPEMRGTLQSQHSGKYNTPMYHVLDREAVLREMAAHFQNTLPPKRCCPPASDSTGNTL